MKQSGDILLLLIYCAFIFYLSDQSTLPIALSFPNQDKLVHATAYAVMALLAWRSMIRLNLSAYLLFALPLMFCSLYGISDEYHQSFVIGRDASVADWWADTLGAMLALLYLTKRRYQ